MPKFDKTLAPAVAYGEVTGSFRLHTTPKKRVKQISLQDVPVFLDDDGAATHVDTGTPKMVQSTDEAGRVLYKKPDGATSVNRYSDDGSETYERAEEQATSSFNFSEDVVDRNGKAIADKIGLTATIGVKDAEGANFKVSSSFNVSDLLPAESAAIAKVLRAVVKRKAVEDELAESWKAYEASLVPTT